MEEGDGPGQEGDVPQQEADGPGQEANGPGQAADGPGEKADGPGEEADGPGEEADGPGEEADGPGEEADGPGEEADGPGEEADGPGEEADGPGEEADGPGEEADGLGDEADTPRQEADSPGDEADGPGQGVNEPGGEGDVDKSNGAKSESDMDEADEAGDGAGKARADGDEAGEDEGELPDAEADRVRDGANKVEVDRFGTDGVRADEITVGRARVEVFGEDGVGADGVKVDELGADGLVRNVLTGSSRTLILKGNFRCDDEDICRTSLNTDSCEQKEESSPNNEPMELSFDSITAEQKEFSAREDHTDACTDNITVEARPTTCKCILPCLIGTECSLLLEQNTEHAEKIDVSSASADLRQVNEWFAKIEGDKSVIADWNDMRTRTRSLSTKVPETVPEETVAESPLQTLCERVIGDPKPVKMDGEVCENMRMIPAKHRRHTFYPRSYSVESRDMPIFVHRETEVSHLDDSRMKRMEDNFSLPSVSSGSQLKCNPLPTSTPSSVVDIPPPFQLASITKKPITKSSPSLLVESESPDKYLKQSAKKKSSFKRFLPIKLSLKKKIENKMAVEVNVCRTPSDTGRGLDFDGRSLGNSPQIKARFGKMCILDSSSTFLINKDGKRKGMPKPFSRSVSRVESFENKLRHSYTSLPLTKPRSISFPNTDTSDYENIPAVSSDYENIQIPPRRNGRSGTVTEFFEDSSRVFTSASENDGYVDMTSFAPFESRQNAEQDLESVDSETLTAWSPNGDEVVSDEDVGNSSESEDIDRDLGKQGDIGLEAYHIAKVMTTSERAYLSVLTFLHTDFREAVACVVGGETCPVMEQEGVTRILCEVSELYELHQEILRELEQSITQ
ncbi:FYVE, RhoGEF and PH domain-containing protein 5-like [Scyliorhinus torazame]|uniref:FYVE, RhoGEF and PH domain-containing protein 5-like n=1 Tax=Scyliorhinus torazame TaxID=75743 RepID=UPI003B5C78D2